MTMTAPIPIGDIDATDPKDWLKQLKIELKRKEEMIASLKQQNAILQGKVVANCSQYGQIEVGLLYHPVAAKLEIHCLNASGLPGTTVS